MALIKCSECGRDVSDKATACPNCGAPVQVISNAPDQSMNASAKDKKLSPDELKDSKREESGCFQIGCGASLLLLLIFYVIGSLAPEYDASKEEFGISTIKVYCGKQVKEKLVDPDSYIFESAQVLATSGDYKQYGLGVLYFRSKNSFGGYVRGTAECKKFDKDGDGGAWIKATIQE